MNEFLDLPKVSFIVITHNFSDFICDCLNSIKKQTYKNIEIIVVDDVSKDDTCGKIDKYIEKNPELEISFIKNQNNKGQLASFLEGLKIAAGQFVAAIDGDDILFPEYCAMHIEAHLKTSVALTTCCSAEIDENNVIHTLNSIESPVKQEKDFCIDNKSFAEFNKYRSAAGIDKSGCNVKVLDNDKYSFATWHWGSASSAMMRKSVCDMLLLLDKTRSLKITADKFIFSFCHLIGSSAVIYKVLYAYRRHNSNYSLANPVMCNKKYFKIKTQNNYFRNNKKIRSQMYKFISLN
ncbi:MAG: glycosyltransferase family 2 protein, partial [Candidatus Gastranaerophilales bacterium]|nr:glycosyltransferase family 2 protein [Candidatus Gastranaerophilales bacterium]